MARALTPRRFALCVFACSRPAQGFECEALLGGQSLFTKYRPRLLQVEGKVPSVRACVEAISRRHGYEIAVRELGRDRNMLLTPSVRGGSVVHRSKER